MLKNSRGGGLYEEHLFYLIAKKKYKRKLLQSYVDRQICIYTYIKLQTEII